MGGHEGDAGDEGEEARVGAAREASRLLREDRQDRDRAEEDGPREEQGGPDREQEEERLGQEELLDRGLQQGACLPEGQGLHRDQEGHSPLQEGEGVHGLSAEECRVYLRLAEGTLALGCGGYSAAYVSEGRLPAWFVEAEADA